jgi:hypothetical protein
MDFVIHDDARLRFHCHDGSWFGRSVGRPDAIRCLKLRGRRVGRQ